MRVITNIDGETYEKIKQLVEAGDYESVDQFLRVAADNQLALERANDQSPPGSSSASQPGSEMSQVSRTESSSTGGPDFQWGYDVPNDIPVGEPHPAQRGSILLFSQYYRFLPLVFALQELAVVTADEHGAVELEVFRKRVSSTVEPLRDALVAWEAENDVKRHERLSTGFPKKDAANPERSLERYLNHYVGHFQVENNEPAGFPHQLGFISIDPTDDSVTIQLTQAGVEFLQFENPVLAHGPMEADTTLSEAEQSYLVSHIRANLGAEFDFMSCVYDTLVEEGPKYTEHLDRFEKFLLEVPSFTDNPSENRVRSHTAGTISRMVELGILERGQRRGHYQGIRPPTAFEVPAEDHQH